MRLFVQQEGKFEDFVTRDLQRIERVHGAAMRSVATEVKAAWRAEIAAAGLGTKLGNTVRSQAYPESGGSLNPAALIWTKAPDIVASHDEGTVIRSADGFWLAIPLAAAGTARFGRRMTPGLFEQRTGQRLRFVYRKGRSALLVVDDARVSARGQARRKGGKRRQDGVLTGAQTIPVFVLVPQVKMRKRTDLIPVADSIANRIPALIAQGWSD